MSAEVISRADARAAGLAHYFTGKPCKNGHVGQRWVSTKNCIACAKDWHAEYRVEKADVISVKEREYREANAERRAARKAAWYRETREERLAVTKAWHERDRDAILERRRQRHAENREAEVAKITAWRQANRSYFAQWRRENRVSRNAEGARWRAVKKLATPAWADPDEILEFYREADRLSKETGYEWHVDHIVPLNNPLVQGLHCQANLRVIPGFENCSKGARWWPDMPEDERAICKILRRAA